MPNLLDGYITDRKECIEKNKKKYEIQYYQNEHSNEYVVSEIQNDKYNGKRQLFKDGVLMQSWNETNGCKVGDFTIYEDGKAICIGYWKAILNKNDICYMANGRDGIHLIIQDNQTKHIIYNGEFNSDDMTREGRGYEYDRDSGKLVSYGIYKNNALFQLIQRFEEDIMIEYAIEENKSNLHLIHRHPIYRGGYCLNEDTNCYERHGRGMKYDANSGLAVLEGEWIHNKINKSTLLHKGWYNTKYCEDSLKCEVYNEMVYTIEPTISNVINTTQDLTTMNKKMTKVYIKPDCGNDDDLTYIDFNDYTSLEVLTIYNNCFMHVEEVHLSDSAIENIKIGSSCYSSCKIFELKQCKQLKEVQIDNDSFSQCNSVCIEDCTEIESIKIGKHVFEGDKNRTNSLTMKNLTKLKDLQGDDNAFGYITDVELDNIPNLINLKLLSAFNQVKRVIVKNSSLLEGFDKLKQVIETETKRKEEYKKRKREQVCIANLQDWQHLTTYVIELTVTSQCCNDDNLTQIDFSYFINLKSVHINDRCFMHVKEVIFNNMPSLEKIKIGYMSFTEFSISQGLWSIKRKDARFICTNNPKLIDLYIDTFAFCEYSECRLENLSELQTINIYRSCFADFSTTVIENLPKLTRMTLYRYTFYGSSTNSSLTMRNLPSLTDLTSIEHCFELVEIVILENIPNVSHVHLPGAFGSTTSRTMNTLANQLTNPWNH